MADAPPPPPKRRRARPGLLPWTGRLLVCLLAVAATAASLYACFDSLHWTVRVVTPFRPQLLAAGIALLVASIALGAGRLTRLITLAPIALNLWFLWPWLVPVTGPVPNHSFKVLAWNTWRGYEPPQEIAEIVAQSGVDVALLCELPRSLKGGSRLQIPGYDTRSHSEYAIAVKQGSLVELVSTKLARPPQCLEARVRFRDQEMRILVTHATRPTTEAGCRFQDLHLQALRRWFDSSPLPSIIVGDFNQTPWCPRLNRLVADLGLRDTSRGRGLTYTYPGDAPYLGRLIGIPIDQCLLTRDLACGSRWVGDAHRSNHRPIFATIGFRGD